MTTVPSDSKGRRAMAALADLARDSVRRPTPAELDSGLDAVRARMFTEQTDPKPAARRAWPASLRWSLVGTMAGALALVAVGVVRSGRPPAPAAPLALSYRIEGGSLVEGGYLRESGRTGIKLFFAEGTEFILMPGTRSRLRSVDGSGARIAIEHGTASFQVTPARAGDRRWQVDVGPFLVTVKGTVFTVSWDAASERFELMLRHGLVTVSGPVTGGEIALRAGQRLRVDLAQGETVIRDPQPDEGPEWPAAPTPSTKESPDKTRTPAAKAAATSPTGRAEGDRAWGVALAAGELDRILAEAERGGVKATLEKASSDDLLALADAARYRRRMDLARDALLAERRRFPDSPRALEASFLLGRVEEASDRRLAKAIEWYDEYLMRSPTGTYASEALGRKMTLTSKLGGPSRARPIAEEYLRRFPSGTYAGPARAFVRGP